MNTQVEAIYENGVFRPLREVRLPDNARVNLTIEAENGTTGGEDRATFSLPPEKWQAFCDALDAPPRVIPALRQLLTQPGVLDDNGTATF